MNCPNCDIEMDREDGAYIKTNGSETIVIPYADYECPECLHQYLWRLDKKGLKDTQTDAWYPIPEEDNKKFFSDHKKCTVHKKEKYDAWVQLSMEVV